MFSFNESPISTKIEKQTIDQSNLTAKQKKTFATEVGKNELERKLAFLCHI